MMRRNSIADAADRVANLLPIGRWAKEPELGQRPRRRILLPAAMIAAAIVLMGWQIAAPTATSLLAILFPVGILLKFAGPLRVPTIAAPLDERERTLRLRANVWGLAVPFVLVLIGCYVQMLRIAWPGIWQPQSLNDWMSVGFLLLILFENIRVLAASLMLPRLPLDQDDLD